MLSFLAKIFSVVFVSSNSLRAVSENPPLSYSFVTFADCGSTTLHPNVVSLNPASPIRGQELAVTVTGQSQAEFASGNVDVKIVYAGIPLVATTLDACALSTNGCPIHTNDNFTLEYIVNLPTYAPVGKYDVQLTVTNQSGAEVGCVSLETNIQ